MSAMENMAIVRRVVDALNKGDVSILDEVCSVDFAYHNPIGPDMDREGLKKAQAMMSMAFPDRHIVVADMFAAEDRVATRATVRATHRGELWGVPPTGKEMAFSSFIIDRFKGDKIVEEWQMTDFLGLMRQLGIVKLPQ
ncbi:MAG: ester cyclase [Chloroflexi bacterium]|nr:ester cyclase [Chloroflexota bacterium]